MNSKDDSIYALLKMLWLTIKRKRKIQFAAVILLMIATSAMEILSIGSAIPFISVIVNPGRVYESDSIKPLVDYFKINSHNELVFAIAVIFGVAATVTSIVKIYMVWLQTKLSYLVGADISEEIYRSALYEDYEQAIKRNSSEVVSGIVTKTNNLVFSVILPVLNIITSIIILVGMAIALSWVDIDTTLKVVIGCSLIYFAVALATRRRLIESGVRVSNNQNKVVKTLQEGIGSLRDVIIDGTQEVHIDSFKVLDLELRRSQIEIQVISAVPRHLIEAIAMVGIAVVACSLAQASNDASATVTALGVLALCAQKILPIIQQVYFALSTIRGGQATLKDTLNMLQNQKIIHTGVQKLQFHKYIDLIKVSYRYGKQNGWVLTEINLRIPRGSRVGIVGESGCGKSTLIDILMGLIPPTTGSLEIDGQVINSSSVIPWRSKIGHVPQTIYLADTTLAKNIALGVAAQEINMDKVKLAAKLAQIEELIEGMPDQYQTVVGERGARLSGGQRQRIGIARALYKNAEVLVFDEATSALDEQTEYEVMKAIEKLDGNITIFMVSHRPSTINMCTHVIKMDRHGVNLVNRKFVSGELLGNVKN
jgi:ABC-type multidrug transport system fused ATPase/permease subunit